MKIGLIYGSDTGATEEISIKIKEAFNNYNIEIIQDIFPSILSQITNNDKLFEELKVERKFFDRFETKTGNINVSNGILVGGKDDGKPLFEKRSYKLPN